MTDHLSNSLPAEPTKSTYTRLLHNRAFLLLWSGEAISTIGDATFNLAVMWVIYAQSHSALMAAGIQASWHLSTGLVSPVTGTLADRWDRKRIMVIANLLSAIVVGAVAVAISLYGHLSLALVIIAVLVLNSIGSISDPARVSVMPELVGRDLLATASGLFAAVGQGTSFLGNALAGIIISSAGGVWAVACDAISFFATAAVTATIMLPGRTETGAISVDRSPILREIIDGWRVIANQPVVRAFVWLSVFINVASFIGPLMPALVRLRLHGGAASYGTLQAISVIGGLLGATLAGRLERSLGAGRLLIVGWSIGGISALGMAGSTSLPLTAVLVAILAFGLTAGSVSMGALMPALVPEQYRGRVYGIMGGLMVAIIPASALLAGWLADELGPAPLFVVAGAWILGAAGLGLRNADLRTARI